MLSIIVPVYNTELHLRRCIDSILSQTYKDFEIILIDDGSSDNSLEICREYEAKDSRVHVFSQENQGVSKTRNRGITLACGEYIQFMDSDDYIEDSMLELLVSTMEKNSADLVICGVSENNHGVIREIKPSIQGTVPKEELSCRYPDIFCDTILNSPCNKLYRKRLIHSCFPEELSMGEDLLFNFSYIRGCKNMSFLQNCPYIYEKLPTGLSSKVRKNTAEIAEIVYESCMAFGEELHFGEEAEKDISDTFVKFLFYGLSAVYSDEERSAYEKKQILLNWMRNENVIRALKAAKLPQLKQKIASFLMKYKMALTMDLLLKIIS